jgi:hypothetical protein
MKEINLNKGLIARVDDEDFEYLNQWKWYALKNGKVYYAQRNVYINGRPKMVKMHRVIMNTDASMEVDHIDGNGLNNQKINLRNCTHRLNTINRKAHGKSKYLGVVITKRGYIFAQLKENGYSHYLGSFKNEEDAAIAYNKAAIIYHKEYAKLNIFEKSYQT